MSSVEYREVSFLTYSDDPQESTPQAVLAKDSRSIREALGKRPRGYKKEKEINVERRSSRGDADIRGEGHRRRKE